MPESRLFEVVDAVTRESEGFFRSFAEAANYGMTGEPGWLFEIWVVAGDNSGTRMLLHGRHRVPSPAVVAH